MIRARYAAAKKRIAADGNCDARIVTGSESRVNASSRTVSIYNYMHINL